MTVPSAGVAGETVPGRPLGGSPPVRRQTLQLIEEEGCRHSGHVSVQASRYSPRSHAATQMRRPSGRTCVVADCHADGVGGDLVGLDVSEFAAEGRGSSLRGT